MARSVNPPPAARPTEAPSPKRAKAKKAGGGKRARNDSDAEDDEPEPAPVPKGKGKGKAKAKAKVAAEPEYWKDTSALIGHSFSLFRLGPLHDFPLPTSPTSLTTWSSSLKLFLERQLALDDGALLGPLPFSRVQAGLVSSLDAILIEIDRVASDDNDDSTTSTTSTSTFVLLPSSSAAATPRSTTTTSSASSYPLLLARSTPSHLTTSLLLFLQTRHDTLPTPLLVPAPSMRTLLSSLIASRDTLSLSPTSLSFAFPPTLATAGLATTTLTIPPPLLDSLDPPDSEEASDFQGNLEKYFLEVTGLSLKECQLVKFGAGRGTYLHGGQGTGGEGGGGAKLKFYKGAKEDGEVEMTLGELVRVAERGR